MKCLEKDRTRRYESAGTLAEDLRRHMEGRTVTARPASPAQRLMKSARRNKVAVAVAATLLSLLVAGTIGTTVGMVRARRAEVVALQQRNAAMAVERDAREKARLATDLWSFMESVLVSAQPVADGGGGAVSLADWLRRAAREADVKLRDQPAAWVKTRVLVGQVFESLGLHKDAEVNLAQGLAAAKREHGDDAPATLQAAIRLASVRARIATDGRMSPTDSFAVKAHAGAREALDLARQRYGEDDPLTWEATAALGEVLLARQQYPAAIPLYVDLLRRMAGAAGFNTAASPAKASETRQFLGPMLRAAAPPSTSPAPLSPAAQEVDRLAGCGQALARALISDTEPMTALSYLRDIYAVDLVRARVAPDLARAYMYNDKYQRTTLVWRAAIDAIKDHSSETHPDVEAAVDGYADVLEQQGKLAEALKQRRLQADRVQAVAPGDHEAIAARLYRAAFLHHHEGEASQGDELFDWAVAMRRRLPDADRTAQSWVRDWIMLRGLGGPQGWGSRALRREVWWAMNRRLTEQPPATDDRLFVDWPTFGFRLYQWHAKDCGTTERGLADALVESGDLAALKALADPKPGVYLLALEVDTHAGTLREASWVLVSPWRLSLYGFTGSSARVESHWLERLVGYPVEVRPSVSCLSIETGPATFDGGPYGRHERFGVVADTTLQLPPGDYRLAFTSDDGLLAWDRPVGLDQNSRATGRIVDAWAQHPPQTDESRFTSSGAPHPLHVEYYQIDSSFCLRVHARPDTPAADEWVATELGPGSDDHRRWLVRDGYLLLQDPLRASDAREQFRRALAAAPRPSDPKADPTHTDALDGMACACSALGDDGEAAHCFGEVFTRRLASLGKSDERTIDAARKWSRAIER